MINKLNEKDVFIDEINISDETFLWIWRNDPLTIKMAKNQKKLVGLSIPRWLKNKEEKKLKFLLQEDSIMKKWECVDFKKIEMI